jgi:hypothetical protein
MKCGKCGSEDYVKAGFIMVNNAINARPAWFCTVY